MKKVLLKIKKSIQFFIGEQEVTARTAGLSSVIVLATIVPLMLLIIIIFYRYVQRKNLEIAMMNQENAFAEMEKHRWLLYQKMQADHLKRESKIEKYLEKQEQPSTSSMGGHNRLDLMNVNDAVDSGGDSTDDEFFERPLSPMPIKSPTASDQTSIIDNEAINPKTPSSSTSFGKVEETPKVENNEHVSTRFKYPSMPSRAPPPPPLQIPSEISNFVPPLSSRSTTTISPSSSLSTSSSMEIIHPVFMNPNRISTHPVIIDITPKSLLESEL